MKSTYQLFEMPFGMGSSASILAKQNANKTKPSLTKQSVADAQKQRDKDEFAKFRARMGK